MIFEKGKSPCNGGVAQLGEHLPCKQGVMGSNPIISTTRQSLEYLLGEVQREIAASNPDGTRAWIPNKRETCDTGMMGRISN